MTDFCSIIRGYLLSLKVSCLIKISYWLFLATHADTKVLPNNSENYQNILWAKTQTKYFLLQNLNFKLYQNISRMFKLRTLKFSKQVLTPYLVSKM